MDPQRELHAYPHGLLENFALGMLRGVPVWRDPPYVGKLHICLNIGAGNKYIEGTKAYDADLGWQAPKLDEADSTVSEIFAYHFFEHLSKAELFRMLRECERVLVPGGVVNVVVPFFGAEIAMQDVDHKLYFSEHTLKMILHDSPYCSGTVPNGWGLCVGATMLMGYTARNLCIIAQLYKP